MKLNKNLLALLLVLSFTLTACANDNAQNNDTNTNSDMNISSISTGEQSFDHGQGEKKEKRDNNFRPIGANTGEGENRAEPRLFERAPQGTIPDSAPNMNEQQSRQTQPEQGQNYGLNEFESQVITLTNEERRRAGLSILEVDNTLSKVARTKSQDMQANNYFSHTSPTYGSPFDMMQQYGISYQSAGENIARGQSTPEEVVRAWMNSEGHRANILNGSYTHIGVGFEQNGNYWTQMFIRK